MARFCSAWCTAICRSWCCRSTPRWSASTRLLEEAAADLGARPSAAVFRVVVPLSKPGIVAGSVLVFIPCLGAYLTPDLLGGGRTVMVGNLVQNQFTSARDWPFGSAVSIGLMVLVTLLLWIFLRREASPWYEALAGSLRRSRSMPSCTCRC